MPFLRLPPELPKPEPCQFGGLTLTVVESRSVYAKNDLWYTWELWRDASEAEAEAESVGELAAQGGLFRTVRECRENLEAVARFMWAAPLPVPER